MMRILAVESSCDETAVAIVEDGRIVLTDCIASQVELHRIYGGVVPEIASRKHIEAIYTLADQALEKTGLTSGEIAYVGDSGTDMTFAIAAGMVPVAAPWGYRSREQLVECGAAYVAEDMAHLGEILLGLA